jgi:hypothetical protein
LLKFEVAVNSVDLIDRPFSVLAAWIGTALVVIRAVPLVLHSAAHVQLGIIPPSLLTNAYIAVVLFLAPVVAAVLLWTRGARAGAWLLFWSMLGSLVFELYNHYMVMSPDHVSQMPEGLWGRIFQATAAATAILEAVGCVLAAYFLAGPLRRTPHQASIDQPAL